MVVEKISASRSADAVAAMNRIAAVSGLSVYPAEQARTLLANPAFHLFMLRAPALSARPVAYLLVQALPPDGEIIDIAVLPWLRRSRFGSRLLAHGLEFLRRRGCGRCVLEVRESNTAAIRFYDRHGFRPAGRRRRYYHHPPEDALVLSRGLEPPIAGVFLS